MKIATSRERDLKAAFAEAISEVGIEGLKATSLFGSQPAQPVAWMAEVHNKYQTRGGYDERIDINEWRQAVTLNEPNGQRYRNIRPLYPAPHPLTVQDAARVPEIAALIEKSEALRDDVTGRVDAFGERIGTAQPMIGFGAKQWADFITALRAIAEGRA